MGQLLKLSNLKWMLLLLIPTSVFVACSDDNYDEPDYSTPFPSASFTHAMSDSGDLMVSFTSTSTGADTYAWDFGDGVGTSTDANPTYNYSAAGDYTVSLTVSNARGTITNSVEIAVEAVTGPSPLLGKWVIAPEAEAIAVGPTVGNYEWWGLNRFGDDVSARACWLDDEYVFNEDGTFQNILGDETWNETWQGVDEGCGAPVAPHDGSNPATFTDNGGSVTVTGLGAFIGLAKVHNGGEDGAPADNTITYDYTISEDGNTMEMTIDFGGGIWYYKLIKTEGLKPFSPAGTWKIAAEDDAIAVGPAIGNYEWWGLNRFGDDVTARACWMDDEYIFNEDGSFQNVLGDETWLEPWQDVDPEACGAPIAPHDGTNPATWSFDENTITVQGLGAFIGLAKVHNGGEDGTPENDTITYTYVASPDGNTLELTITGFNGGDETWYFKLVRQ